MAEEKFRIIATNRATNQREPITPPMSAEAANAYKPSKFDKQYYKYFKPAKVKVKKSQQ